MLLLFIVSLYALQIKVITPLVLKALDSDFFFAKDDEQEELGKIRNERTGFAFTQCKEAMKAENQVAENAQFADAEYEAWALGGKTYVIRSHIITSQGTEAIDRKYACKIKFSGGDLSDSNNWSIMGIDFNEPTNES